MKKENLKKTKQTNNNDLFSTKDCQISSKERNSVTTRSCKKIDFFHICDYAIYKLELISKIFWLIINVMKKDVSKNPN